MRSRRRKECKIKAYIVSAKDADDLAAAVQLHEQPLVDVLLQLGLCGGHCASVECSARGIHCFSGMGPDAKAVGGG